MALENAYPVLNDPVHLQSLCFEHHVPIFWNLLSREEGHAKEGYIELVVGFFQADHCAHALLYARKCAGTQFCKM